MLVLVIMSKFDKSPINKNFSRTVLELLGLFQFKVVIITDLGQGQKSA